MSDSSEFETLSGASEVSIERRASERKLVRTAVTISSDSNLYVGFSDDMSEGGLFVATHEILPIGDVVDLEFVLPGDDEPICVRAEVRWHRAFADLENNVLPGFGAKFIDLAPDDSARLDEFLQTREAMFHPE